MHHTPPKTLELELELDLGPGRTTDAL